MVVQNGLKVEVEARGPSVCCRMDGARVPPREPLARRSLQILDEDGGVLIRLPLSSSGMMAQGAIENCPRKDAGPPKQLLKAAPAFSGSKWPQSTTCQRTGRPPDKDLDASRCTMIAAVVPNSPAASAGCRGTSSSANQAQCRSSNLVIHHRGHATRHCLSAIIIRDGQKMKVEIELGARPKRPPPATTSAAEAQCKT